MNDLVKVACPPLRVAVPRLVVPSLNVIVPVGLLPVTVAVSVTVCRTKAGLGLIASDVVEVVFAQPIGLASKHTKPTSNIASEFLRAAERKRLAKAFTDIIMMYYPTLRIS